MFEFLTEYLKTAGFQKIKQVADFGLFNDTSRLRFLGIPISLNMEAIK
jgi:hypothetical protein